MSLLRILGLALSVLGIAMAAFPSWFGVLTGGPDPPVDVFETIERRIRGGMVLGVGLVLIARTALRPWSTLLPTIVLYFVFGALLVRLGALVVDGQDGRQWMWVAGEAFVVGLAGIWLWRATATI